MQNLNQNEDPSARCVNGPQSRNLRKQEAGQGLVEYILVVFLMGLVAIVAVKKLSSSTQNGFTTAASSLDTAFKPPAQ